MAKICQIGAGLIGKTMAIDLSKDHDLHLADFNIDNSGTLENLKKQVNKIISEL